MSHYFTATWPLRLFRGLTSRMTWVRVPPSPKFFCANFFRLCETFFANISKGSTLHFFVYFAKEWMLKNFQRAPFYMFRHYATYGRPKKLKNFKKNWIFFLLLFLSLRYGADLGRSRLVNIFCDSRNIIEISRIRLFSWTVFVY